MQQCSGCDNEVEIGRQYCAECEAEAEEAEAELAYDGDDLFDWSHNGKPEPCDHEFKELYNGMAQCIHCGVIED